MPVYLNVAHPLEGWSYALTGGDIVRQLDAHPEADGFVVRNADTGAIYMVVVRHPAQIKSAIGNRGTFDPKDPNILHGLARLSSGVVWRTTQAQVDAVRAGWWCGGKPMVLVEVPIRRLLAVNFRTGQPTRDAAASERRRIDALVGAFQAGNAMAPAVGYPVDHPAGGYFQVHDGNHRVAAARRLGIARAVMLVCEGHIMAASHGAQSMARMKPPMGLR